MQTATIQIVRRPGIAFCTGSRGLGLGCGLGDRGGRSKQSNPASAIDLAFGLACDIIYVLEWVLFDLAFEAEVSWSYLSQLKAGTRVGGRAGLVAERAKKEKRSTVAFLSKVLPFLFRPVWQTGIHRALRRVYSILRRASSRSWRSRARRAFRSARICRAIRRLSRRHCARRHRARALRAVDCGRLSSDRTGPACLRILVWPASAHAGFHGSSRSSLSPRARSVPSISHRAGGNTLIRARPNFCIDCAVGILLTHLRGLPDHGQFSEQAGIARQNRKPRR